MRGLAASKLVGLIIIVIVIAVSLFFLTAVADLELLFPSDLTTLRQYSTCALAYCSAGADSDEVRAVGCLENDAGPCEMTCLDVEEKIFNPDKYSFKDAFGRKHYCGKENAIPFEFGLTGIGGTVDIRSGQMDQFAKKPAWVCKSFEVFGYEVDDVFGDLPFVGVAGISTADWAYHGKLLDLFGEHPQNCLMLSKSRPDWASYGNTLLFIGSFFVGGPQTVAAGKLALAGATSGAAAKAASGIVISTPPKVLAKTFVNLPGKGEVQQWTIQGATRGAVATGGVNLIAASDPFNFAKLKTNGGCFSGFVYDNLGDSNPSNKNLLYTPLIQYQKGKEWQKVYPSAIYVDESFTGVSGQGEPECEFYNPSRASAKLAGEDVTKIEEFKRSYVEDKANRAKYESIVIEEKNEDGVPTTRSPTAEEVDQILQSEASAAAIAKFGGDDPIVGLDMYGPFSQQFDYGNMLRECKFKKRDDGGRLIQYSVWASPTFPGIGTMNALSRGGYDLESAEVEIEGGTISKNVLTDFTGDVAQKENSFEFFERAFKPIFEKIDEVKKESVEAFSGFGSCAYVTLSRDLETSPLKTSETSAETSVETDAKLEIKSDKTEYQSGEPVVFSGTLQVDNEAAKGKEVKILVSQFLLRDTNPLTHRPILTLTDENGNFKTETKFETQKKFKFEVVAQYENIKSEPYAFTVG